MDSDFVSMVKDEILSNCRNSEQEEWMKFACSYLQVYYERQTFLGSGERHRQRRYRELLSICQRNPVVLTNASGGCGKSWLVSQLTKFVQNCIPMSSVPAWSLYEKSETDEDMCVRDEDMAYGRMGRVAVLAPSGVAASNAGGHTFNDALRTFPITYEQVQMEISPNLLSKLAIDFNRVVCIVIDEFSMVSVEMLAYLDKILRAIRPAFSDIVFGGLPVFFMGDAFQLPVVGGQGLLTDPEKIDKRGYSIFEHCTSNCFLPELKGSVRHINDDGLRKCLERVRKAVATKEDVELLNSRYIPSVSYLEDEDVRWKTATILAATNEQVDHYNTAAVLRHGTVKGTYHVSAVPVSILGRSKEKRLKGIKNFFRTGRLHSAKRPIRKFKGKRKLRQGFKITPRFIAYPGMPVILRINICPSLGLCNGAIGKIVGMHNRKNISHHETDQIWSAI